MTSILKFTILFFTFAAGTSVSAEKFDAKSFVGEKCSGCHDSSVYTRSNRRVDSLPRLKSQVQMCDAQLGIKMFDEDVDSVVLHLNTEYYHFSQK